MMAEIVEAQASGRAGDLAEIGLAFFVGADGCRLLQLAEGQRIARVRLRQEVRQPSLVTKHEAGR